MFYAIAKGILRVFMTFVFRIRTRGKENILSEGGAIFAVNHGSNWDPVLVALTSSRRLSFMAKSELFENKLLGAIIKACGAFPVKRGKGDLGAIKTALTILKNNNVMIIFPEGKRVEKGERVEAKPGATMLATHAKVPVIPVSISGKYRWLSKMTVTYGEPVFFDEYYGEKLSVEKLQELSQSVMNRIYEQKGAAENVH